MIIDPALTGYTRERKAYELENARQYWLTFAWLCVWLGATWLITASIATHALTAWIGIGVYFVATGACILLSNLNWLRRI